MSWKSLFYATAFVASLCLPHSPMGALAQSLPAMPEDNATLSHAPEDNSAAERSMKDNSAEMGGAGISRESGTSGEPGTPENSAKAGELGGSKAYRQLLSYIEGIEAIADLAKDGTRDRQVCDAMAQKLVEYGRTHRDFRTVLGYATDRINDKEIAIIMNKAREIGKKLAVCYDNREVSEFLSMMMEQE